MDKEFCLKLKESLIALDTRITALEHLVNETIIGGLKRAAEEYDDDVRFSEFCDVHSPEYEMYIEPSKILNGDDFDLPSYLYESVKGTEGYGTEGFDEGSTVTALLQAIRDKIDALKSLEEKVESSEEEEEKVEESTEEDIPSDEQLREEFAKYGK